MAEQKPILLFQSRDERGSRSLLATTLADSRLKLDGQDLGPSVAFFAEDLTEFRAGGRPVEERAW